MRDALERKPRTKSRWKPAARPAAVNGELPPHDDAAERGALGCILSAASERDADAMLSALRAELFYDLRHQKLLGIYQELRAAHRAVDLITVTSQAAGHAAELGGVTYLNALEDEVPSPANFPSYLDALEHAALLRGAAAKAARVADLVRNRVDEEGNPLGLDDLRAALKEMAEDIARPVRGERPVLTITDPTQHLSYEPREDLCLVGDHDITKGYEGVAVIGGPPGSGKSLVASSLALAGARGRGEWMGRTVHRKFRTLVVQAENGALRLRREFEAMTASQPDVSKWVRVSLPPEGGLPFHRAEFRRAVSAAVQDFQPDVVVLDPWTAVAAEDAAKDVVDKLAEIRSCLPAGDDCPALVIVAHTRKPKAEGMRRGRGLLNELSGSLALGATARSVFILLPFTDDIQDDRVLWSCAKLSNGAPPADSVWHRQLGDLFRPASASADEFWNRGEEEKERVAVSKGQLREAFGDRLGMSREDVVAKLQELELCSYQTARRITGPAGYLLTRGWLKETPGGLLALG